MLFFGMAEFALGWSIASGWIGPYEEALARYTSAASSGQVIDRATRYIGIALALGTLAEIGLAMRRRAKGETAPGDDRGDN
jgi:hypothetical protein